MTEVYKNATQVQYIYKQLFNDVQTANPKSMDSITKSKMVIRFRLTEPAVDMWVDGRSKPVYAYFGAQDIKPTITATMTANTLHEILLGTLPLGKAMSAHRLRVSGSMLKLFKLEDLLHKCQSQYPAIAKEYFG